MGISLLNCQDIFKFRSLFFNVKDLLILMKYTGHSRSSTFLSYIGENLYNQDLL